jgi:hypothetical protein
MYTPEKGRFKKALTTLFFDHYGLRAGWFFSLFIAGVFLAGYALIYAGTVWECNAYQRMTGRKTEVAALTCYVQYGNAMVPYDELRARAITNEADK